MPDGKPERLVEVSLPVRVGRVYTYAVPQGIEPVLGGRVLVPFGKRKEAEGYVVGFPQTRPDVELKHVIASLDDKPLVSGPMISFTRWLHGYYRAPWGEVISSSVPPAARSQHGGGRERKVVLAVERARAQEHLESLAGKHPGQAKVLQALLSRETPEMWLQDLVRACEISYSPVNTLARANLIRMESGRRPFSPGRPEPGGPPLELTRPQAEALAGINKAVQDGGFKVFLLRGVTGSGKTEVYLKAIEAALAAGKSAITLVPEIALTPQMVGRYMSRFSEVTVLHSSLSGSERAAQWEAVRSGKSRVVVGARSAVFAPTRDLGVIVVDEEHEPSFKQDSSPRYHARDAAVMRASMEKAVVILGSATPSLESWANSVSGRYGLFTLPARVRDLPMPDVEITDMSVEARETGKLPVFSRRLEALARESLSRREQVILFLNRRGFSRVLQCVSCGFRYECPNCRIPLTYHKKINRAVCHFCYHGEVPTGSCPSCLSPAIKYHGIGTEKVQEIVRTLFPDAVCARMDSDSMGSRDDYEEVFRAFSAKEVDVLIGTQMIAKGLDFPNVTLVGVIAADASLSLPDFRAAERTFQLITQVAGRAGRSERGGRVVVQTFQPNHYSIRCAAAQDFVAFASREMAFRKEQGYPPFGRLARVMVTGKKEAAVRGKAKSVAERLAAAKGVTILGPAPAPVEVIRNKFRHQVVVKASGDKAAQAVQAALDLISADLYEGRSTRVFADVDPQGML